MGATVGVHGHFKFLTRAAFHVGFVAHVRFLRDSLHSLDVSARGLLLDRLLSRRWDAIEHHFLLQYQQRLALVTFLRSKPLHVRQQRSGCQPWKPARLSIPAIPPAVSWPGRSAQLSA